MERIMTGLTGIPARNTKFTYVIVMEVIIN
jgi:hypothetical protein